MVRRGEKFIFTVFCWKTGIGFGLPLFCPKIKKKNLFSRGGFLLKFGNFLEKKIFSSFFRGLFYGGGEKKKKIFFFPRVLQKEYGAAFIFDFFFFFPREGKRPLIDFFILKKKSPVFYFFFFSSLKP